MLDSQDRDHNKRITINFSCDSRMNTEHMIESFHSRLRRLEKRLKTCSRERHHPSCLCPWAIENEPADISGGRRRMLDEEAAHIMTQDRVRRKARPPVSIEVINKSSPPPSTTEQRPGFTYVDTYFPRPVSPLPDYEPPSLPVQPPPSMGSPPRLLFNPPVKKLPPRRSHSPSGRPTVPSSRSPTLHVVPSVSPPRRSHPNRPAQVPSPGCSSESETEVKMLDVRVPVEPPKQFAIGEIYRRKMRSPIKDQEKRGAPETIGTSSGEPVIPVGVVTAAARPAKQRATHFARVSSPRLCTSMRRRHGTHTSPRIRTRHEALVPSPPQGSPRLLGFSQRGERPKRKRQQIVPHQKQPQQRFKPLITPSTWREELQALKQKQAVSEAGKDDEQGHYSDDFDSDNEEAEKENKVVTKTAVSKKSPSRRPVPPSAAPSPPKSRHYDPSVVQNYIHKQKQMRASHCKEQNQIQQIQSNHRESQLKALQIRAKRIVAASVRKQREQQANMKPKENNLTTPNNTPRKNKEKSRTPTKSPEVSHNSSIRNNNSRVSDEFIDKLTSMHMPRPAHQLILSETLAQEDKEIRLRSLERSQELKVQRALSAQSLRNDAVDSTLPRGSPPSVAAARSTAHFIEHVVNSVRADAAATKIQAAFRGFRTRRRNKKTIKTKKQSSTQTTRTVNILESWLQKSDADPFNFIQSVKRKLSEATRKESVIQILPSNTQSQLQNQPDEEKYESDFESSALSISPSEDIHIGSDSRGASQHSLASITPDRNDEISALASQSPISSHSASPEHLVAPNVALVVHTNGEVRPSSAPSSKSSSDSRLLSTSSETPQPRSEHKSQHSSGETGSRETLAHPVLQYEHLTVKTSTSHLVLSKPVEKNTYKPSLFLEKQTKYSLEFTSQNEQSNINVQQNRNSLPEIALSNSDASIKELEMSIEAGFGRLTEEINAVRKIFGLPCPEEDRQQDVLPLDSHFQGLDLIAPEEKIQQPYKSETVPKPQGSPELSYASANYDLRVSETDKKHGSETENSASSPTITEGILGGAQSEVTTSGGLPRVRGAAQELEQSFASAQGSLQQLADQESLEEISEHVSEEYSSKFEEMESEEAGSAKSGDFSSITATASDVLTEINGKDDRVKATARARRKAVSSSDSQRQGSSEQDSFTVFSLAMFQQLVRDQELRARHQRALLKQREDAIFEKSKAELILLENQKKQLRSTGMESLIPGIKKRQRAILMRLNQERDEIKRLRESHKMASQERRLMLQQQQHIARMRIAARELTSKLQDKDLPLKSQRLLEPSRRQMAAPSEEESSAASLSLDTSDFSQSKASSEPEPDLASVGSLRDMLHGRKKDSKNKRLLVAANEKHQEVHEHETIERVTDNLIPPDVNLLSENQVTSQQPSLRDCSTSPLPPSESCLQDEGEEVINTHDLSQPTQSISENINDDTRPSPSALEISPLESKIYTNDSFESPNASASVQDAASDRERTLPAAEPPKIASFRPPVTIKVPLSPRLQGKQKRRHSSGSDESIVLSQNETASEQSDVESRICALQEQLRRRKMEAERLRREQKRNHRERLRAKEQSLLKQIQAYDSYIQDTRRELEQEFEAGLATIGGVKPQIKQPRVAEKSSNRRCSESSDSGSLVPEIKSSESHKNIEQIEKEYVKTKLKPESTQNEISTVSEATSVPLDSSIKEILEPPSQDRSLELNNFDQQKSKEESVIDISAIESQIIPPPLLEHESQKPSFSEPEYTSNFSSNQGISEEILSQASESQEAKSPTVVVKLEQEENNQEPVVLETKTEEIAQVLDERTEYAPTSDILSQESASADSSLETTIESPRRGAEVEEEKEESEEDIAESLGTSVSSQDLQEDVPRDKEEEVNQITNYLLQKLITDSLKFTCDKVQEKKEIVSDERFEEASRIAEELSQQLLDEAFSQLWPIYYKRKNQNQEKPESVTHNILERVQSLLGQSEISSPRDQSPRPQDLMVTTYVEESLSPEPGSPELLQAEGHGRGDDSTSATEPLSVQVDEVEQTSKAAEASRVDEDAAAESAISPPQDWFDEDFGLSSTRREAEELRLQQLQIEQEIQQLQAQQYPYYYVREIPNKPPPPYTPPGESPKSPEEAQQVPGAVPASREQILPLVSRATETLYHARLAGRELESVQPSWEPELEQDSEACAVYKHFLFDLSRQLVQEAYSCPDQQAPPWLEPPAVRRRKALLMPKSLQELQQRVEDQVMVLFGFSKRTRREKLIIRWSRKRRDHVDELLVREAQEEEQAWTNYELDEAAVKSQLADAMLNMLLSDTVAAVSKAVENKTKNLREQDNET